MNKVDVQEEAIDPWADIDTPATDAELMGLDADEGTEDAQDGGDAAVDGNGQESEQAQPATAEGSDAQGDADIDVDALRAVLGDEDAPRRDQIIPRARFDEVNNARRDAEARAAELEARLEAELAAKTATQQAASNQGDRAPPSPEPLASFDFDAKEREYLGAQWEGDTDRAVALRREIDEEKSRQMIERATEEAIRKAEALAAEKESARAAREAANAAGRVAHEIVERMPFLVENDGDNQAMRDFAEWRDFYVASKGMSMPDAMTAAAERIAPMYAPPAKEDDPKPAAEPDARHQKAVERGVATSQRQPAPLSESGTGNRVVPPMPNIETQDDWDRLPEKERERLLAG